MLFGGKPYPIVAQQGMISRLQLLAKRSNSTMNSVRYGENDLMPRLAGP